MFHVTKDTIPNKYNSTNRISSKKNSKNISGIMNSPRWDSSNMTNPSQGSFVPDPTGGWVCPHCMVTPYHLRAPGSFSRHPPSIAYIDQHFANCFGLATSYQSSEKGIEERPSTYLPSFHSPARDLPHASGESLYHFNEQGSADSQTALFRPLQSPSGEIPSSSSWSSRAGPNTGQSSTNASTSDASFFYPSLHPPSSSAISSMSYQQPQYPHYQRPQLEFQNIVTMAPPSARSLNNAQAAAEYLAALSSERSKLQPDEEEALVLIEDRQIVTDYIYYLFQQLRICRFLEADRKTRGGKRDNLIIGYGGLECRHCAGDGSRKFFWTKADRLGNSLSEISGHVMKCHKCNGQIKEALKELKLHHLEQMARLPRGSQKLFFRRVWRRLHGNDEAGGVASGSSIVASSPCSPSSQRKYSSDEERMGNEQELAAGSSAAISPLRLAVSSDTLWLSDLECSVRASLEVFCASEADVMASQSSQSHPVKPNQVGMRCIYCSSTHDGATDLAVLFPPSISAIYDNVQEFHRMHLSHCGNIPENEVDKLSRLDKPTKAFARMSRRHYIEAAKSLGFYDTSDGIFMHPSMSMGGSDAPIGIMEVQRGGQESTEGGGGITSMGYFGDKATMSPESQACDFEGLSHDAFNSSPKRKEVPSFPDSEDNHIGKKPSFDPNGRH